MGSYSKLTEKGLNGAFFVALEAQLSRGIAGRTGAMMESDEASETYRGLGASPAMREWVGGRLEKKLRPLEYTLTNKKYEATLPIDVDDIRRDKLNMIMRRVRDLGRKAAQHWDRLAYDAIVAGTTTACYDGQYFFATDHVEGDSGTQINKVAAAQIGSLNVTTATAPTADEMASILVDSVAYMLSYLDDQGEPMNGEAREFVAYVPLNMFGSTLRALTAENLSAGATNQIKGLEEEGYSIGLVAEPRLGMAGAVFYLFRTDGEMRPMILQEELPLQTQTIGAGSEEEFKNDRWLFGVKAVRAVGYGLWQHAMHLTLS